MPFDWSIGIYPETFGPTSFERGDLSDTRIWLNQREYCTAKRCEKYALRELVLTTTGNIGHVSLNAPHEKTQGLLLQALRVGANDAQSVYRDSIPVALTEAREPATAGAYHHHRWNSHCCC